MGDFPRFRQNVTCKFFCWTRYHRLQRGKAIENGFRVRVEQSVKHIHIEHDSLTARRCT
jgi:hypothetical protein